MEAKTEEPNNKVEIAEPEPKEQKDSVKETEAKTEENGVKEDKKKKKKKKKKKGKKDETEETKKVNTSFPEEDKTKPATRAQDNSTLRILKNWEDGPYKQTVYPTIPIDDQYSDGNFPLGLVVPYTGEYSHRMSAPEEKKKEELLEVQYKCFRKAAECHRQARHFAQRIIRPGESYMKLVTEIENAVRRLIKANKTEANLAFPCGFSINSCAAHFTPNPGDTKILQKEDVVKIDIGTHYQGYIVDSAFTVAFDPTFDNLLEAGKEATMTGVKEAGIDARLDEIGEKIQETMESYEVTIKGKTRPIKSVRNLQGHEVARYKIHAGKAVPTVKGAKPEKMEEGEVYAIETFASTGKGYVVEDGECSHYMKSSELKHLPIKDTRAKFLLKLLEENYSTLAFCRRWIDDMGFEK